MLVDCCDSSFLIDGRCGVLTVEIEHVDAATLEELEKQGVDCEPKASTISIIQANFSSLCQPSVHLFILLLSITTKCIYILEMLHLPRQR